MDNLQGYGNVWLVEATSQDASTLPINNADLIYLDGSHEYDDVAFDIEAWYPKANKILCGDDYSEWWPGVRAAVDESGLDINTDQRLWYLVK